MAYTTQYIGSRYVPMFADPAEWNNKRTYEPLTIVLNEGNSYTSRQFVPVGIDISNDDYWAETGNYNAQVEAYRREVQSFDGRITANANSISAEKTRAESAEQTLQTGIDAEKTRAEGTEQTLQGNIAALQPRVTSNENSIAALEAGRGRMGIGVYIGNSYTDGVGSSDGQTGFFARTRHILFNDSYSFTSGGIGFAKYSDHDTTFNDMVSRASASAQFDNDKVNAVIFTCAMGDTRAICEKGYNAWVNGLATTINNAKAAFPNAAIIVQYAETIFGRNVQKSYSTNYNQVQYYTHYALGVLATQYGYTYIGWTGWNSNQQNGFNYTDNYHPNDAGYNAIVASFFNGFYGESPYRTRTYQYRIPNCTQNNMVEIQAYSPFDCMLNINNLTKEVFGASYTAGAVIDLLVLCDADTGNGGSSVLPFTFNLGSPLHVPVRFNYSTMKFVTLSESFNVQTGLTRLSMTYNENISAEDIAGLSNSLYGNFRFSSLKRSLPI